MKYYKSFFALLIFTFSTNALADGFDGCFQLYLEGATFPAICIDGTLEEGIAGAGARMSIIDAH